MSRATQKAARRARSARSPSPLWPSKPDSSAPECARQSTAAFSSCRTRAVLEEHPPSSRAPEGPLARRITAALGRLLEVQIRRPYHVLFVIAVVTAISVLFALRLTVQTGFQALLPESRKSVQE